ncbi:MAG: FmdB family zinc ribbon protein [Nitriliruptoraceae bacterium]
MPTYEYACRACGEHLEVVQSFRDDPLSECPACQGQLRKVFSAAGIIFKGSGWHVKDYASSNRPANGASGSADADGKRSSGSSSGETGKGGESGKAGETGKGGESGKGGKASDRQASASKADSSTSSGERAASA